jgi:hypothetical protein
MLDSTDPSIPVMSRSAPPNFAPRPASPPPAPPPQPPPIRDVSEPDDAATRVIKPPSAVRRKVRVVRPLGELSDEIPAPAPPAAVPPPPPVAPAPPAAVAPPRVDPPKVEAPTAAPPTKAPSAPVPSARPSGIPTPAPRSTNWLGLAIVGTLVAVLVVAVVAIVLRTRSTGETPAQPPPDVQATPSATPPTSPAPSPTVPAPDTTKPADTTTAAETPPPAPTEPAPAAALTTVFVDVRPWARVKIVPPAPDPAVPADALYAPFAVDLPPGTYTFECENGGVTRPLTFKVTVAAGPTQGVTRTMPGFNATKTVDSLLGQND